MRRGLWILVVALAVGLPRGAKGQTGPFEFYPLTPCRVLDTRTNVNGPLVQGDPVSYTITGDPCGIPSTAQAVVLNATMLNEAADGYLSLWAAGTTNPGLAILNVAANGPAIANGATIIITPGTGYNITAFYGGKFIGPTADLLLDVVGYLQ